MFLQILLIVSSFLTLYVLESEGVNLANAIDIAGLNRFLTSRTINEFHILEHKGITDEKITSLDELEKNIMILKEGGFKEGIYINKILPKFEEEWNNVFDDFQKFRDSILDNNLKLDEKTTVIEQKGNELIESSDALVKTIAEHVESKNTLLIRLQVMFLFINTIAHVLLILLVFRILNNETKNRMKLERFAIIGKMGASIAHDLRNSLTVIKGSLDILDMKNLIKDEDIARKQQEKIQKSVGEIEYLTKDILSYSQMRENKKEEVELAEIINDTIKTLEIPDKIKVEVSDKKIKIVIDKIKIQTVISNLIGNAIDAIEDKGTISIKLYESPLEVTLAVRDSGKGFSSKEIEKIFDPLYTTKMKGTGLGLASCKRIIEEHGGKIEVKRNPTSFIITLPKQSQK